MEAADTPPRPAIKKIAMRVYFEMVRAGHPTIITKQLLWAGVEEMCKVLGFPVPGNRAKILRAIGLDGLPEAPRGRKKELG